MTRRSRGVILISAALSLGGVAACGSNQAPVDSATNPWKSQIDGAAAPTRNSSGGGGVGIVECELLSPSAAQKILGVGVPPKNTTELRQDKPTHPTGCIYDFPGGSGPTEIERVETESFPNTPVEKYLPELRAPVMDLTEINSADLGLGAGAALFETPEGKRTTGVQVIVAWNNPAGNVRILSAFSYRSSIAGDLRDAVVKQAQAMQAALS